VILIGDALQDVVVDQVVEPLVQDVSRDPETGLEVVEAGDTQEGVANDEQAPPFAHYLQALGDRAVHLLETRPLHETNYRGLRYRTHIS